MANTHMLISTTTLTSSASNITFSSIPQTYTDLILKFSTRADQSDSNDSFDTVIKFNGSTSNLKFVSVRGDGAGVNYNSLTDRMLRTTDPSNYTASTFSNVEIYVFDYTSSNYKTFSVDSVVGNNATGAPQILIAGQWSNTAAITSIGIFASGGVATNFVSGTIASLYGIKNS